METDEDFRGRIIQALFVRGIKAPSCVNIATGLPLDTIGHLVNLVRKGESMAKLSERTNTTVATVTTNAIPSIQFNKGETNMNTNNTGTLRTLNLTLIDNNPNLKVEGKVVFQKLGHMTEHNDERTIQQILMSGDVAKALEAHNVERVKVVDKEIQRATGRDVKLEEVEIFNLDWQVVRVA
jgi:hypothetical protein